MRRCEAVAGRFYPDDPERLQQTVADLQPGDIDPAAAVGLIGPHAGLRYSGEILAAAYASVHVPPTVVILCPNHTGLGARGAVFARGRWALPGGDLEVDEVLASEVVERTSLSEDSEAHRHEHAIEVHLPLLRARRSDVRIVPICLHHHTLECSEALATELAAVLDGRDDVLVVASTDMTHFLRDDAARRVDARAISCIEALDPRALHERVEAERISMCGYVPTTVCMLVAQKLGANRARLVRYGTSADQGGDPARVVGYASFVIDRVDH